MRMDGDRKPATIEDTGDADTQLPGPATAREVADLPITARERYAIQAEHARGGLGVILRAEDRQLERTVALKELAASASDRASTRFLREALITARLQHPGIVPVYEAGRWPDGSPYYAMKLVSGRTLREEVKASTTLDARLALVPRVLAVAEAVGYAHSEGVIHRDLKPDNIMVGAFGETIVVDWGLAKDRRQSLDEPKESGLYAMAHAESTRIGAVIGTPAYMAPEQARGQDVDERADVWAIGAILYYVLAAQPAYSGAPELVIARVAEEPPEPLARRVPGIPRDLLAIVDKAMARDPAMRYPNAKALAEDLSRFLTGQLVGARSYGRLALIEHWVRRHRAPVMVAGVLLAVLAVFATISIRRILGERRIAQARSDELLVTQARSQLDRDPTAALAWLAQYPASGADLEGVRGIAADASSRGIARHVWGGHPAGVLAMAIAPDGNLVATGSEHVVQLWDPLTGHRIARLAHSAVIAMAFSPDGRRLAITGEDGAVTLTDVASGATRTLGKRAATVSAIAFAPGVLVTGDYSGSVRAWPLDGGPDRELAHHDGAIFKIAVVGGDVLSIGAVDLVVQRASLDGKRAERVLAMATRFHDADHVHDIAIAPDGKAIAIALEDRVLRWAFGEAAPVDLMGHRTDAVMVAIAPTGKIVSGGGDGGLLAWTPGDREIKKLVGHDHPISQLAVSADGALVASGDSTGEVRVWTATGGEVLRGHTGAITVLAFDPRGGLFSASDDRTVRMWPPPRPSRAIPIGPAIIYKLAFIGTAIATASQDGRVHLVGGDGVPRVVGEHAQQAYDLERLPDGGFATSAWDGSIILYAPDGTVRRTLQHGVQVWNIAASADGTQLASTGADGTVKLWDVATGAGRELEKREGSADDVAFSPDGKTLVVSGADTDLHVFDLARGGAPRVFHGHTDDALSLTFAADGKIVYSAGLDGVVRGWDIATGASRAFTGHTGQVRTIALSPDQRYLASGGVDGLVIVWDLANGGRARVMRGHTDEVRHVTFSPDGTQLASAGWDGAVRLWSLADGRITVWRGHDGKVHRVAFSPDGKLVASAGTDGTVRLWPIDDAARIPVGHAALISWIAGRTTAAIDDSGAASTSDE